MTDKKPKTPLIMITSRLLFAALFITGFVITFLNLFPQSEFSITWLVYLVCIYTAAEIIYNIFLKEDIDLAYAFPLLFSIFALNFVSLLFNGQENLPDLNRAEHLTSFVFTAYIIWIFFTKYLPHEVWQKHPYYTSILVLAVTSMLGVGNEIIEFFLDITFGTKLVGAGYDTSYDLVMNTLGAGLFLSFRLIYGILNEKS